MGTAAAHFLFQSTGWTAEMRVMHKELRRKGNKQAPEAVKSSTNPLSMYRERGLTAPVSVGSLLVQNTCQNQPQASALPL